MIFVTVDYNMMLPSYIEAALLINLDKLQKKFLSLLQVYGQIRHGTVHCQELKRIISAVKKVSK